MLTLLLDDEQTFIDDFCEVATEQGYEVISYLSVRDVWNFLSKGESTPNICFVDYKLSNQKGTEFIRELRQRGFVFPVVLLTHLDDPQIAFDAGISGATTFCLKDAILSSSSALTTIINNTLKEYELRRDSSIRRTEQTYQGINNVINEFIHDIKDVIIPMSESAQFALSILANDEVEYLSLVTDELEEIIGQCDEGIKYLSNLSNKVNINIDKPNLELVNVNDFIQNCCDSYIKINRPVNINCFVEVVFFDSSIVERILKHLFTNIEKHVPTNAAVDITIISQEQSPTSILKIIVRDHGLGIPEELMETIFRLGVVGEKKTGNMGLGLSIAKNLAEAYILEDVRGRLYCVNLPDSPGARFILEIPLRRESE